MPRSGSRSLAVALALFVGASWCDFALCHPAALEVAQRNDGEKKNSDEQTDTELDRPVVLDEELASEILKELRALRSEVDQLQRAVSEIHRAAVPAPAAANAPPTASVSVALDDDPVLGDPQAPIAIVEFSDYQCPFCKRFTDQTFPRLKSTYIDTGKVRYVFRDLPLEQIHPEARPAAIAANCAAREGKYWTMHDRLFEQQRELGPEVYDQLVGEMDLDRTAFETCVTDPASSQEVDRDIADAVSIDVRGTPHFFVGRVVDGRIVDAVRLSGAQPFARFEQILESIAR